MNWKRNILAFVIISLLGTLGHFVYEWSGQNTVLGFIFPVNESVWEHLKLLFFPTVIYSVFEYCKVKESYDNYISAAVLSIFYGMLMIVVIYYVSKGLFGRDISFINISSYYVAVILMLKRKNKILENETFSSRNITLILLMATVVTALLFLFWSYKSPMAEIFIPPIP